MDNTVNNGRIDQKNIKFPTNIYDCNCCPVTHNGGLNPLSAQTGLNIRNNPAQHLVGDETTDEHRWTQKRKSVFSGVYPWLHIKGKNPTICVGCRFKNSSEQRVASSEAFISLDSHYSLPATRYYAWCLCTKPR